MPDSPDLRQTVANAMAEAAGSKAFREHGREWDHMRSVWYGHADAALAAIQDQYVPPPPGDDRAKLPDHLLAVIRPDPYISSYEQIADALEAAIPGNPNLADELQMWADRMRDSCRQTRKQDMAPCAHPKHRHRDGAKPVTPERVARAYADAGHPEVARLLRHTADGTMHDMHDDEEPEPS